MSDRQLDDYLAKKISFANANDNIDQLKVCISWLDNWNMDKVKEKLWNK